VGKGEGREVDDGGSNINDPPSLKEKKKRLSLLPLLVWKTPHSCLWEKGAKNERGRKKRGPPASTRQNKKGGFFFFEEKKGYSDAGRGEKGYPSSVAERKEKSTSALEKMIMLELEKGGNVGKEKKGDGCAQEEGRGGALYSRPAARPNTRPRLTWKKGRGKHLAACRRKTTEKEKKGKSFLRGKNRAVVSEQKRNEVWK